MNPIQPTNRLTAYLTQPAVLKISGLTYLALTAGFVLVMWVWEFQVIDELFLKQEIIDSVGALSQTQKQVHILTTATLDVAYPFTYGAFQAGMAYRYLGRIGTFIAPLSLLCIPVDLLEGFSQVMILSNQPQFIELKTIATPIKLMLYIPGLLAALVALGLAIKGRRLGS